jgi:hypothetical protein
MSLAGEAYDLLSGEDRLSLLGALGFDEPQRYRGWEDREMSYSRMLYEVQEELNLCFVKGEWRIPEGVPTTKRKKRNYA